MKVHLISVRDLRAEGVDTVLRAMAKIIRKRREKNTVPPPPPIPKNRAARKKAAEPKKAGWSP